MKINGKLFKSFFFRKYLNNYFNKLVILVFYRLLKNHILFFYLPYYLNLKNIFVVSQTLIKYSKELSLIMNRIKVITVL